MAVLIALIFHDRDLTSDARKDCIVTNLEIPDNHISWEIQVWSWKIFEQSRFDVPVSEMLCQVNHQVAVIAIWHIRQTRQWWKERQDTKYKN